MSKISNFDFDFENYELNTEELRKLINEEIALYHDADFCNKYYEDKKLYKKSN